MILVFTGDGKGKTTAAIGQGIRAVGQGKRVVCYQFIKSPSWPSGEEEVIESLAPKFVLIKGGLGFVGILGDDLPFSAHRSAALKTMNEASFAINSGKYDMIILDEINVAVSLKLISENEVLKILDGAPEEIDIILTGRGAPEKFLSRADLATEAVARKHPYQNGQKARRGIEY